MKKILIIFAAGFLSLPLQSCRETVPPETLEDEAPSTEDTADTTTAVFYRTNSGYEAVRKG